MPISDRHRDALARLTSEDFESAAAMLGDLLKTGPANWIVKNDLALGLSMLGRTEEAARLLEEVLADEPGNSFALINRFYVLAADEVRRAPLPDPRAKVRDQRGQGPERALVTVVMPTFNRPDLIRESLESVRAQTMTEWELIVVNDGGDRAVEKTLEPYLADPRVRYALAEHGGLSSARNVGLFLAKGEYLTQLDDDDIFYPEHLETVVRAFREHPEIKVVYTDFYRASQERKGGQWVTTRRVLDYSKDFSRAAFRHGTYIPVCNLTQHRETLAAVGFYNEPVLRAMDWEYFTRLSRKYDFLHVARVTGEFREKSDRSQMTRSFQIPRNFHRNLVSFLHGFFPLTGERFLQPNLGAGPALKNALDRLLARDRDHFFMKRLELRKLLVEPYYALFYTLGKRVSEEGDPDRARQAFRAALALRPLELKIWLRLLRP